MQKVIEIMADEATKVLAKKYGCTEAQVVNAAIAGNTKVIGDLQKLVSSLRK